jgi:hypothetical protein
MESRKEKNRNHVKEMLKGVDIKRKGKEIDMG